jgi:hypothetical protein
MKTPEEKKKAQAEAHRRWRQSEKGKAYIQRLKEKSAGVNQPTANNDTPSPSA